MKYFIAFVLSFILFGCGSGSNSGSNEQTPDKNIVQKTYNSLLYQQWAIYKDADFYNENEVDANANVHAQKVFNNYTGKGVKVAVIDEGFDTHHPEIKDKIIKTIFVKIDGSVSSDVSETSVDDYHGTAVAGIIAAKNDGVGVRGLAPDVKLILIKMPTASELSDATEIELFQEAVKNGADVINCSWGSGDVSDAVKDYINEISSTARGGKGVNIVFASGNSGHPMQNDESAINGVVGVGATDKENLRIFYSDFGKDLDIMAPGGYKLGIATIDPVGTKGETVDNYNRYDEVRDGYNVSFRGTSASAPIITASIALALQKNPSLTRVEIQNLLKHATDHISNNAPYIDDMITSSTQTPTITGIFGANQSNNIKVRLIAKSNGKIYGDYSVNSTGNGSWSSNVTDRLPEGNYTVEVISDDGFVVWCTDSNFEINLSKKDAVDKNAKKSDFYGYGKINVAKMLDNVQ